MSTTDRADRRKTELRVLKVEQAKALVEAASKIRNGALFTVAMAVGLRVGEACGLRWQDVDLDAKTLRVVQAVEWRRGKASIGEPKSDTSRRIVRLPEFAVEALKKHRTSQKVDKLAAGKDWVETGLLFTTTKGTVLDYSNVRKEFKKLLREGELPDVRLHDLRHTCATILMAQGVAPKVVMETLGHSQVNLTLGTYSHVSLELLGTAANKMDEVFRSA
jgi:integrase